MHGIHCLTLVLESIIVTDVMSGNMLTFGWTASLRGGTAGQLALTETRCRYMDHAAGAWGSAAGEVGRVVSWLTMKGYGRRLVSSSSLLGVYALSEGPRRFRRPLSTMSTMSTMGYRLEDVEWTLQ